MIFPLPSLIPAKTVIYGLAALAVVVGMVAVKNLIADNARLELERNAAVKTASDNAIALREANDYTILVAETLTEERDKTLARLEKLTNLRSDIRNAPETDDGPVAPVLARTLDGLRDGPHAATDQGGTVTHP